MDSEELRAKLKSEVGAVDAAALLPHHRRDALLILQPECDLLDVAFAIASDDAREVQRLADGGSLYKPSLGQVADWIAEASMRFQFVVLQPFVLAQEILESNLTEN
jgi:hypothetical protein